MIFAHFDCEVYRVDLFIVYADDIPTAEIELRKKAKFGIEEENLEDWQAGYVQNKSRFALLLMPSERLLRNINHESNHIAMSILNRAGVPHTVETDEAFCYLADWVFDKTVSLLRKKGISV